MKSALLTLLATSVFMAGSAFGAAITDVTYEGNNANAVYGHFGAPKNNQNDSVEAINALGIAGNPFVKLDKTDEGSSPFLGVTFTLSASGNPGNWALSWAQTGDPGLPLAMDFLLVLKAGPSWAAWLFEDVSFTASPTSGSGTFEFSWLNNGGKVPGLSHASIYGRGVHFTPPPPPSAEVPEPSVLVLLGLGMLGLGLSRRKFNAA